MKNKASNPFLPIIKGNRDDQILIIFSITMKVTTSINPKTRSLVYVPNVCAQPRRF